MHHLNEVRRIRNDKKIQIKDLKLTISERVKQEIEFDFRIQKDSASSMVPNFLCKTFYSRKSPSSFSIAKKYSNKDK